jgi:Flp pilus assembly protein TadB
MTHYSFALLLLAAALLVPSRANVPSKRLAGLAAQPKTRVRRRVPSQRLAIASAGLVAALATGWPAGVIAGPLVAAAVWWFLRRARRPPKTDPMTVAAAWDLLAACLRAGLPVPTAITVAAGELPPTVAQPLRASADLLALGAEPDTAWSPAIACPDTAALARGARRAARSGTALAELATDLAARVRSNAADAAEATAQRAGVLVIVPLGVCFLPAFILLGIAPVIAGMAAQISL